MAHGTGTRFEAAVPQFTVPDVVGAAEWYRDVLGFRIAGYWNGEAPSIETDPPPLFTIVARDRIQVFFNRADGSSPRTGRAEGAYDLYLRVSGLDALARDLHARGVEILEGPVDRSYGQRELIVRDCNGLVLALGQEIPEGLRRPDDEAERLRATERERLHALVTGDIERAAGLHTEDFQLINPLGGALSKEQYLGGIASGQIHYLFWEPESIAVRLYGDVAVIRYRSQLEIVVQGRHIPRQGYWHTDLYERHETEWQVAWSHATVAGPS